MIVNSKITDIKGIKTALSVTVSPSLNSPINGIVTNNVNNNNVNNNNLINNNINRNYIDNNKVIRNGDWHYPMQPYLIDDEPATTDPDEVLDVVVAEPEIAKPPMYAVVMYNDDYTPMEFVVYILQSHFRHNVDSAVEIMLSIHHKGRGIAGIYPKDIAETKAKKVNTEAKKEGYPLLTQIEPHQGD